MGNSQDKCVICASDTLDASGSRVSCANCGAPHCRRCWGNIIRCISCARQINYPVSNGSKVPVADIDVPNFLSLPSRDQVLILGSARWISILCIANVIASSCWQALCSLTEISRALITSNGAVLMSALSVWAISRYLTQPSS